MKKIRRLVSMLLVAMLLITGVACGMSALAEQTHYTFPLPAGKYQVSTLNQYTDGSQHGSYLNRYVLGKSTAPTNNVIDIPAAKGTKVMAIADGTVYSNYWTSGGGWIVVIKHTDGTYSYYGHLLSQGCVKKNSKVKQGQTIGYVGMTGTATGYHLHFEMSNGDPYCLFSSYWSGLQLGAKKYGHTHSKAKTYVVASFNVNRKGTMIKTCFVESSCVSSALKKAGNGMLFKGNSVGVVSGMINYAYHDLWLKVTYSSGKTGYVKSSSVDY